VYLLSGAPIQVSEVSYSPCTIIARNVLFFSGNSWNSHYAMGYATSSSPPGPFTPYSGNPILQGNAHAHGPGGGSVVEGTDNDLWMVYHAWPGREGYDHGGIRNMRIDPLVWDGSKVSITVTAR